MTGRVQVVQQVLSLFRSDNACQRPGDSDTPFKMQTLLKPLFANMCMRVSPALAWKVCVLVNLQEEVLVYK